MGYTPDEMVEEVAANDLCQAVFSVEGAVALSRAAAKLGKNARVHIKVDTGMGRLGFFPDKRSMDEICSIAELPGLEMEGLFTHLAKSDSVDLSFAEEQLGRFERFKKGLAERGLSFPVCHAANSGGILAGEKYHLDMVRAGIIIYGLDPSTEICARELGFIPAMSVKAKVSMVKRVEKGSSVGYGRAFFAPNDMIVATVPIGYADGFLRRMSNGGRVLASGQYAPVIGNVCMDQFMVDASAAQGLKASDEAVILGFQKGNAITAGEMARVSGTISYEIACGFSARMPRIFINESIVQAEAN
jgi:alanine racemase